MTACDQPLLWAGTQHKLHLLADMPTWYTLPKLLFVDTLLLPKFR